MSIELLPDRWWAQLLDPRSSIFACSARIVSLSSSGSFLPLRLKSSAARRPATPFSTGGSSSDARGIRRPVLTSCVRASRLPKSRGLWTQRHGFSVSLCSDLLVLGDQQTSDRSFRYCLISGISLVVWDRSGWCQGLLGLIYLWWHAVWHHKFVSSFF